MKKFEKILLWALALLLIAAIICTCFYYREQKKITAYSAACMDQVRAEVGDELSNIVYLFAGKIEGKYVYGGSFSIDESDYEFACAAANKDDIQVQIQPLNAEADESQDTDDELTNLGANYYTIIGPDYGFDEQINQGTLVLRADYVDHVDYVFLPSGTWEQSLDPINYRTNVLFDGSVRSIDGAAGSHYYQAETIDQLSYQE